MTRIHPTALVDKGAQLHESVVVGPYSVIGAHVRIGKNTRIGAHCVIEGHTTIGEDNHIFQFNSLGAIPQDKKYAGEPCELIIGDRNTVREFCTFNIGTSSDKALTRIGNDNWIMAYVHLAHDCIVGNNTIFANNSSLAGHVQVDDFVILGGFTTVHQFCRLGAHAFTSINAMIWADLPPFVMCQGQPAKARSMNYEGLKRRGFASERIKAIKDMYRLLYRDNLTLEQSKTAISELAHQVPEAAQDVRMMLDFLSAPSADRGIVR
jgi:UDP-N-acetylglucosamine acyltransferase